MGTDTDIFYQACVCGQGQIEITITSPDHRWHSAYNVHRSYAFKCAPCAGEYIIDDRGAVMRRSEQAASHQGREDWYAAMREYDASPEVVALKKAFGGYLAGLKTKKAAHEALTVLGITTDKYASFIRRYVDADSYASGIHTIHAPTMASVVGVDPAPFVANTARLKAMSEEIPSARSVMTVKPLGD